MTESILENNSEHSEGDQLPAIPVGLFARGLYKVLDNKI